MRKLKPFSNSYPTEEFALHAVSSPNTFSIIPYHERYVPDSTFTLRVHDANCPGIDWTPVITGPYLASCQDALRLYRYCWNSHSSRGLYAMFEQSPRAE